MPKGFTTILAIILGLLVVGGGAYFYLNIDKDNGDDDEVNPDNLIELIYPNTGDDIPYSDIFMAGDLHYRWTVSNSDYVPSDNGRAYIIDENGNEVREDKISLGVVEYEKNTFVNTFVGESGIEIGSKYKVKICDYVSGNKVCDESNGFFSIVNAQENDNTSVLPSGWYFTKGGGDNFAILKSENSNDHIEARYFDNLNVFEIDNGKFGKVTLTYSASKECWLLGQDNAKSGFVENCVEPAKTNRGDSIFQIHNGYGYIIPKSYYSFALITLIGDDKDSLEEIVKGDYLFQGETEEDWKLYPEGKPIIEFISPHEGPIGTKVTITGQELAGFEGDLVAYFEREDGEVIELWDNNGADSTFQVTVEEPCQEGDIVHGRYSGIAQECDYVEFTPGTYWVYTKPWGYKSNAFQFNLLDSGTGYQSISECDVMEDSNVSATKDICYIGFALQDLDSNICSLLHFDSYKLRCYGKIAFETEDKNLCDYVGNYKNMCIENIDNGFYKELRN